MARKPEPKLKDATLQKLCDIIGDTATGLTGREIGRYLSECNIADPHPAMTKRDRLFEALSVNQNEDRCANGVLALIKHVMDPVLYVDQREVFENRRSTLNLVLAFGGIVLDDKGRLRRSVPARTISEAAATASMLRKSLVERKVHGDVLRYCRAELVADDYFHAVFEATKSVAEKLRDKAGLDSDGSTLVDAALGIGKAGTPRLALDILTTLSLIHRRLDSAVRTHVQ